ncbi:uncharacterized protein LOC111048895 isoform X2 [Nilaparvata lugens]|uniref:uncharacterized protein LOC111048895 isoform X2 n=1 Tax=Nilaparvata lugens TaxID=108931 RepID=UPI00193CA54E|nr:uncharacterized protein LOC111048895 isoform X2 [Nilaparvata lugens]
METPKKKEKIVPVFKNLGFIVPKKNKSKNAVKRGDGSSTENSPRVDEDNSDSSNACSDVSETSSKGSNSSTVLSSVSHNSIKGREEPSVAAKSLEAKQSNKKPEFARPFSAIFKPIDKKTTETPRPTTDSGEIAAKSPKSQEKLLGKTAAKTISKKKSPKSQEKLLGKTAAKTISKKKSSKKLSQKKITLLTTEQYDDIFDSVIKSAISQVEASPEMDASLEMDASHETSLQGNDKESTTETDIIPNTSDAAKFVPYNEKENSANKQTVERAAVLSNTALASKKQKITEEGSSDDYTAEEKLTEQKNSLVISDSPAARKIPKICLTRLPLREKTVNEKPSLTDISARISELESDETNFENYISAMKNKELDKPKNGSKLDISDEASSSTSKQQPASSPTFSHSVNDSSTIDVYDFEEDDVQHLILNTQKTTWGKDRSIIYDKPPKTKNYKEQMLYLRQCRTIGLWVQCTNRGCGKYRYCRELKDPQDVPEIWTCSMNTDKAFNDCSIEEQRQPWEVEGEVDVISSKYTAGSVVWAHLQGWPWWPAIVDDDPDTQMFWWPKPETWYHVVFFGAKVNRCWVRDQCVKPFDGNNNFKSMKTTIKKDKGLAGQLEAAIATAAAARAMPLTERLAKFSFVARFKGPFVEPRLELDSSSSDESSQENHSFSSQSSLSSRNVLGKRKARKLKKPKRQISKKSAIDSLSTVGDLEKRKLKRQVSKKLAINRLSTVGDESGNDMKGEGDGKVKGDSGVGGTKECIVDVVAEDTPATATKQCKVDVVAEDTPATATKQCIVDVVAEDMPATNKCIVDLVVEDTPATNKCIVDLVSIADSESDADVIAEDTPATATKQCKVDVVAEDTPATNKCIVDLVSIADSESDADVIAEDTPATATKQCKVDVVAEDTPATNKCIVDLVSIADSESDVDVMAVDDSESEVHVEAVEFSASEEGDVDVVGLDYDSDDSEWSDRSIISHVSNTDIQQSHSEDTSALHQGAVTKTE